MKNSILPLSYSDTIDILAPASKALRNELKDAEEYLLKRGYKSRRPDNIYDFQCKLFSNFDEKRFEFLKDSLVKSQSNYLWCLRGGYGSMRLLPALSKLKKPHKFKLLLGSSDITSLHIFLNQNWSWPTLHSPMLARMGAGRASKKEEIEIFDILTGKKSNLEFKLKPMNKIARSKKNISGKILGGNLMTVQSSLGTPWQIKPRGDILFFEEINERGYRVDRMLQSLMQAGVFKNTKAILLGDFIGGKESDGKNLVKLVLKEFASQIHLPVFYGLQAGHGKIQRTLPLGIKSDIVMKSGHKLITPLDFIKK